MRYLFEDLGYDVSCPSPLLINNKLAIQVAKHPKHQVMMKHIHCVYHWIQDMIGQSLISVSNVPGDDNLVDIFTKPLGRINVAKGETR